MSRISFLIVDDDQAVVGMLQEELSKIFKNALIYVADDGMTGLRKLKNATPTLAIVDVRMPKMGASEMLGLAFDPRQKGIKKFPVICMTGLGKEDPELDAIRALGVPIIHKPFKLAELVQLAQREIKNFRIAEPN